MLCLDVIDSENLIFSDSGIFIHWYITNPTSEEVGKRSTDGYLGRKPLRWYTIWAELAETAATF